MQVFNNNEKNDQNEKQLKLIKGRKGDIRKTLLILYYLRLYQVIPECSINIPLKQQKEAEAKKQVANVAAVFTSGGCKALQCGPSLSRLKNLLLKSFLGVDLVSASRNVLETSRKSMGPDSWRVERIYNPRLEEFNPEPKRFYDVIWLQGVVTHLQDEDLVYLLARLKSALTPVSNSESAVSAQFTPSPSAKSGGSRKFSEHLLKQLPLERGGVIIVKVHVPRWLSANATKHEHHAHVHFTLDLVQIIKCSESPTFFTCSVLKRYVSSYFTHTRTHNHTNY